MEKVKLSDEEIKKLIESMPFALEASNQGGQTIKLGGTTEQQIKYYILKFGMMPTDLYIAKSGNVEFKKSGRFRLANQVGWVESRMEIVATDNKNFAMIKARVRVKDSEDWKEDISSCQGGDNGKQSWRFSDVIATASTRALTRALQQIAPVPTGQGDLDETDADLISHKMIQDKLAADIEKAAKKTEAKTKAPADYKKKSSAPAKPEPMEDIIIPPELDKED